MHLSVDGAQQTKQVAPAEALQGAPVTVLQFRGAHALVARNLFSLHRAYGLQRFFSRDDGAEDGFCAVDRGVNDVAGREERRQNVIGIRCCILGEGELLDVANAAHAGTFIDNNIV